MVGIQLFGRRAHRHLNHSGYDRRGLSHGRRDQRNKCTNIRRRRLDGSGLRFSAGTQQCGKRLHGSEVTVGRRREVAQSGTLKLKANHPCYVQGTHPVIRRGDNINHKGALHAPRCRFCRIAGGDLKLVVREPDGLGAGRAEDGLPEVAEATIVPVAQVRTVGKRFDRCLLAPGIQLDKEGCSPAPINVVVIKRKCQRCENGNDRHANQQFDQREAAAMFFYHWVRGHCLQMAISWTTSVLKRR